MGLIKHPRKFIYVVIGSISLALGILGIFLPVLPTTPFFLLTSWLYMNSSEKLYKKVMENRYFGNIVRNFRENKSIPLKTKIISISMLWGTILFSVFLFVSLFWIQMLLICIAIGVTIHILSYKTMKEINEKD